MDKKISEFQALTALTGTDIFPVVSAGLNKKITADDLISSIRSFVSPIVSPTNSNIPLTSEKVLLVIPATYTLNAGTHGQEILIVDVTTGSTVNTPSSPTSAVTLTNNGSVKLIYINTIGWIVEHSRNATVVP